MPRDSLDRVKLDIASEKKDMRNYMKTTLIPRLEAAIVLSLRFWGIVAEWRWDCSKGL